MRHHVEVLVENGSEIAEFLYAGPTILRSQNAKGGCRRSRCIFREGQKQPDFEEASTRIVSLGPNSVDERRAEPPEEHQIGKNVVLDDIQHFRIA